MFSLKSELFKKQQQISSKSGETTEVIRKQHKIKNASDQSEKTESYVKNHGVEERNRRDIVATSEEIDKEKRVQPVLEAKAKLYDKMTSGDALPDEESSSLFLVDFEQKSIEARLKKTGVDLDKKPQLSVNVASELKKASETAENEWMEYVDSLGRTRTCLRKDLPSLRRMDDKLNVDRRAKQQTGDVNKTLLSDDMRREMQREEWEQEAMEEINGPLHYENLRAGEIRELGVGYYQFSTDQETRDAQMKMLHKMREETKKEKENLRETQKKKRTALQARLEKVKERKIKKLKAQGKEIPPELLKPIELPEPEPEIKEVPQPDEIEVEVTKVKYLKETTEREWDKGKEWSPATPALPPKTWRDPREERPEEFAPPSFYYKGPKNKRGQWAANNASATQQEIPRPPEAGTSSGGADNVVGPNLTPADVITQIRQGVENAVNHSGTAPGASGLITDLSKTLQGTIDKKDVQVSSNTDAKVPSDLQARMSRVLNHVEQSFGMGQSKSDDSANMYIPTDKPITLKIKPVIRKNKVLITKSALEES